MFQWEEKLEASLVELIATNTKQCWIYSTELMYMWAFHRFGIKQHFYRCL